MRDPSTNHAGHLVNGSAFLPQPIQVRALETPNPAAPYAAVPENGLA